MKKYIGTKEVKAMPCTLGDFIAKTGRNPYHNDGKVHGNDEEGYLVEYQDGYQSWSPKEVFENAYQCAETPLDRMLIEGRELTEKREKLERFIESEKFSELDETTRAMLVSQLSIMKNYQNVLNQRYTKMESGNGSLCMIPFGMAYYLMCSGFLLRRRGWNGKGLFVYKQVPSNIDRDVIPYMTSMPQAAKDRILDKQGVIDFTSQCIIYNENTGRADSWVPSISDIFADDWEIVCREDE